jgi:hypothetical protein
METPAKELRKELVPRTNSTFLKILATIITYVFHPVFMPTVVTIMLYKISAISFAGVSASDLNKWLAIIILNTLFFPLLLVVLLKALGFISSIRMVDPKDRIIPLMGTMVFYFWAYNVFSNITAPFILRVLLLGVFWGVIVLFMVNIFFKISIHTMTAGGVLGLFIILTFLSPINMTMPLLAVIIIAGCIGTARLLLGAHNPPQIYLGYFLGILSMVAAYGYLK